MGLGAFEFHHVDAYLSGRHFELSVGISYKASYATIFVADGKVNPAAREADLKPGNPPFGGSISPNGVLTNLQHNQWERRAAVVGV